MLAVIQDIWIISASEDTPRFKELLEEGSKFGVSLQYGIQPSSDGLAQAFIVGKTFIGMDTCAMILMKQI